MDLDFDLSTGQKVGYTVKAGIFAWLCFVPGKFIYNIIINLESIAAEMTRESLRTLTVLNSVAFFGLTSIFTFYILWETADLLQETVDMKEGELD
jgi:hypothetical protein